MGNMVQYFILSGANKKSRPLNNLSEAAKLSSGINIFFVNLLIEENTAGLFLWVILI